MNAETIAIGTELLIGQISNTNARYLSEKLNELGINVYYHTVVGDNMKRILEVLNIAKKRSKYIFLTGGLGPTQDDVTRDAVAQFADVPLKEDAKAKEKIEAFFKSKNIPMPISNLNQALIPDGSTILANDYGTAPGFLLPFEESLIICLPGPPREMQNMFQNQVLPKISKEDFRPITSKYIKLFGIGESLVEEKILDLISAQTSPSIATYANEGSLTIRLTAQKNKENNTDCFEPVLSQIIERLKDNIYSIDNEYLHEVVGKLLIKTNTTIATAESCTGGLISKHLTDVAGISSVFHTGFVTYSNDAKIRLLGVSEKTLKTYGAVSSQTALEMSKGARDKSGTDIGIAVTGIAGPGGGTFEKPVGLVYLGYCDNKKHFAKELRLSGSREKIRNLTVLNAFKTILESRPPHDETK